MKNLIKYEIRKTWQTKLILLTITLFAELAFLATLYLGIENYNPLTCMILYFLALGGILYIGIQSVVTMHQDMNTKQGYMLYMTPHNCYRILGAKVLENGLSLLAAGAFFFALGVLDISLLMGHYGILEEMLRYIREIMRSMQMELQLNTGSFIALAVAFLTGWLSTVMIAYLADVISTCLLAGKKHNGFFSLLAFILISILFSTLENACTGTLAWLPRLWWSSAISLAFSGIMYVVTAWLMDRHLSV